MATRKKQLSRDEIHAMCGSIKLKTSGKLFSQSDNHERLFTSNGLLLTPTIDHLFDRGLFPLKTAANCLSHRWLTKNP